MSSNFSSSPPPNQATNVRAIITANRLLWAKILIYGLLVMTTTYFFIEDFAASSHTFRGGVTLGNVTAAFATATDSFSWLILLLVFELETHTLEDATLKRGWRWLLLAITVFAYWFVLQAFLGYVNTLEITLGFTAIGDADFCAAAARDALSVASTLDEYRPITANACAALDPALYLWNPDVGIIATPTVAEEMRWLAWADVINASTWLLVVLVLEADVILQLGGSLSDRLYRWSVRVTILFYAVLIAAVLAWFLFAQWVDALDAILWLLAFFLIELNLLNWREDPSPNQKEVY